MIHHPGPKHKNLPKLMPSEGICIINHTCFFSIVCTIDTLTGNVFAWTADVNAALAGVDVIGSKVDAVVRGYEIHEGWIIFAPLNIVCGVSEGNGLYGWKERWVFAKMMGQLTPQGRMLKDRNGSHFSASC